MRSRNDRTTRSDFNIVNLEEVVVIALAAQRLARAISTDEITAPLRDRLDDWATSQNDRPFAGRVAARLSDLVRCPVCTGWWTSLVVSALWPGRARLRRAMSVAGLQVFLTLAERLISEHGRAAVHQADITEARNRAGESKRPQVAAVGE